MVYLHEQVDVGRGQRINEEVSGQGREAMMLDREAVDDLGQVEEESLGVRGSVKHGGEEVSAAAADVGDGAERAKVVGPQDRGDVGAGFSGHRVPEHLRLGRPVLEVSPNTGRLNGLHGWRTRANRMSEEPECWNGGSTDPSSRGKARIDIGSSLRSSRDAGV